MSNKTNITRPIDTANGYDLEIEVSVSRDGICCHGYLNGECVVVKFGAEAETEVRVHLYRAVTWELNNGARENLSNKEQPMQTQPTYAELVEAREQAYIAQRDSEEITSQIKTALTAAIWAEPEHKNDTARKAELMIRLRDYEADFETAQAAADAYRRACNAIEVYQEQAKDARARLRYETALLEVKAAELHLQVAQAKHDAAEPTDEDAYGNMPHQKPDAIKCSIIPNFETQHAWILDVWNALSTIPSGKSAGYVAKCVHEGRVCNELIVNPEDGRVVVFSNKGDCQDYAIAMCDLHGFGTWSAREVWYEMPF